MAQFKNYDAARNACSTSSTGVLTLGDNIPGAQSIKAKMSSGDTAKFYFRKGSQWISFLGTFTAPDQLARTRVIDGSGGTATNVDFGAGAGEVGLDASAEDLDVLNLIETTTVSAATFDIGAVYARHIVSSGTTGPVTSLGTSANKERLVKWSGQTVNHHATSLKLIGGANWVTIAGDYSLMKSDSSGNWQEIWRRPADGHPLITGQATIASATTTDLGSVLAQSITVSGTTTITGFGSSTPAGATKNLHFSGALQITHNATSMINPGAVNITTVAGATAVVRHEGSGNWRIISFKQGGIAIKAPTIQVFASGSGTYTTPTGCKAIRVRIAGGGGGGGGTGAGSGNGGAGGNTTFSTLTANGGNGASGGAGLGATGGTASGGDVNISGGGGGSSPAGNVNFQGGNGGNSAFGGGGVGGYGAGSNTAGATNSGGGGGGAFGSASLASMGGGGAGGYSEKIIAAPAATYSYAVGAAGAAGTAGTGGNAGSAGGSGIVIVEEFYD